MHTTYVALHEQRKLVHPTDVEKRRYKRLLLCDSHTSRIACGRNAVSLLERRQQRYIKGDQQGKGKKKRNKKKKNRFQSKTNKE